MKYRIYRRRGFYEKTFSKALWISAIVVLSISSLIACGRGGGGSQAQDPGYVSPIGLTPNPNYSFYSMNSAMRNYYYPGDVAHLNIGGAYSKFLRDVMGVCDRRFYFNGTDSGLANCTSWTSGLNDIVIITDGINSSSAKIIVRSYPLSSSQNGWYYASIPNAKDFLAGIIGIGNFHNYQGMYNPLVLEGSIWPWNEDAGFKLQTHAPSGSFANGAAGPAIEFEVLQGKIEDSSFNFVLKYNYQVVLSGRMNKCKSQNCGLQ